jgi:hypothetical protein
VELCEKIGSNVCPPIFSHNSTICEYILKIQKAFERKSNFLSNSCIATCSMNKGTRQNEKKMYSKTANGKVTKIKTKNATTFLRIKFFLNHLGVVIAQ